MRLRWRVPAFYFEEAVEDAAFWKSEAEKYQRQARRLFDAAKRTEMDLQAELFRVQSDLSWALDANARLALENTELSFQLKGEA